jgi:CBS domain-containing protein
VTVALFNLLPGFPLDGGRVLRAVLWARGGEELRATRAASRVGRAVAAGLAGLGLLAVFGGGALSGMWLVFIGWVLWNAADATYRERLLQVSLVGLRAGDLVDGTVAWVEPDTTLATLVRSRALPHGTRTFIVASAGGAVLGLVSLSDVQRVPESAWETTTVFRVMTPRERLVGVSADAEALAALRLMVEHDLNQLPVFAADGGLAGVLTRGALLQAIEVRARLSAGPRRS